MLSISHNVECMCRSHAIIHKNGWLEAESRCRWIHTVRNRKLNHRGRSSHTHTRDKPILIAVQENDKHSSTPGTSIPGVHVTHSTEQQTRNSKHTKDTFIVTVSSIYNRLHSTALSDQEWNGGILLLQVNIVLFYKVPVHKTKHNIHAQ